VPGVEKVAVEQACEYHFLPFAALLSRFENFVVVVELVVLVSLHGCCALAWKELY